jgi:putative ABC transport system ATP-binding protein
VSLIELSGIGRTVKLPTGEPLEILRGVDLTLVEGQHVAIVGRSGSGKSTLLNLLGLLDTPTAGEYRLDGQPVSRLSGSRRSQLRGRTFGFVFQQFNLLPRRTATENVCVPLLYASGVQFWRRRRFAHDVLAQVGLGDRLDTTPEKLSGGEQQRVAIARALVRSPRIILADEPTGALDVDTGAVVMDLLEDVCAQRGATLITITHDLAVAARAQRRLDHGVLTPMDDAEPLTEARPAESTPVVRVRPTAPAARHPRSDAAVISAAVTSAAVTSAPKTSAPKTSAPKTSAPKTSAPLTSAADTDVVVSGSAQLTPAPVEPGPRWWRIRRRDPEPQMLDVDPPVLTQAVDGETSTVDDDDSLATELYEGGRR